MLRAADASSEPGPLRIDEWRGVSVRDFGTDRSRPPMLLIHGLGMTADSCWGRNYQHLAQYGRVIAFDLRGHGSGVPVRRRFSIEDCADDCHALAGTLGLEPFVAVGYSLGGLVAQMLWSRHRDALAGMVLCATAHFPLSPFEWAMAALPSATKSNSAARKRLGAAEPRVLLSATQAAARFDSRSWVHAIDVPAEVVVTARDVVIAPFRQRWLWKALPRATKREVSAGHLAPVSRSQLFGHAIAAAYQSVAARAMTGR
jgi:3-oxoadipate enol-lactonase